MAYSELIKSFSRIRTYMRSFYVYGFKHRGEFDEKSARGYDNERRRIESWLGDYMSFGQDGDGRRVFLSVDSRSVSSNPLYRAFHTKSFTDRDIMLHFQLLDILPETEGPSIFEIMEELSERLNAFDEGDAPDESTVRKKLTEYEKLGLVVKTKRGRESVYCRSSCPLDLGTWSEAAAFFSEAAPLGVIGSFVRELLPGTADCFRFKQHYILNALDSEVLCALAEAMGESGMRSMTTFSLTAMWPGRRRTMITNTLWTWASCSLSWKLLRGRSLPGSKRHTAPAIGNGMWSCCARKSITAAC